MLAYMTFTATLQTEELTFAVRRDGELCAAGVKQQQLIKEQQARIEKQQKELEALNEENLQLKNELDKLKNRSSQNSSVPPSQDIVKKPSDKSKRKKGKKRGPKYNHCGGDIVLALPLAHQAAIFAGSPETRFCRNYRVS